MPSSPNTYSMYFNVQYLLNISVIAAFTWSILPSRNILIKFSGFILFFLYLILLFFISAHYKCHLLSFPYQLCAISSFWFTLLKSFLIYFLHTLIIHKSICIPTESLSNQCDSRSAMDFWTFSKVNIYQLPLLFSVITAFCFAATVPSRAWRHRHLASSPEQMTSICSKTTKRF